MREFSKIQADRLTVLLRDRQFAQWVAAARDGDMAAFESLYGATSKLLLHVVRRIGCDGFAEDVLTDTYFQAWTDLDKFDPARSTVMTWLVTIACSRARDRMRVERSRHGGLSGAPEFDPDTEAHQGAGPEDIASLDQQHRRLYEALATLGGKDRWVLGLAYFQDLTHSEISFTTGIPLGTVKTLIRRAHARMRVIIQSRAAELAPLNDHSYDTPIAAAAI